MYKIVLTEGVTLTATRSTLDRLYAEIDAERREAEVKCIEAEKAEARRREVEALWAMDPEDPLFSDWYKDLYGVRPHFEWR